MDLKNNILFDFSNNNIQIFLNIKEIYDFPSLEIFKKYIDHTNNIYTLSSPIRFIDENNISNDKYVIYSQKKTELHKSPVIVDSFLIYIKKKSTGDELKVSLRNLDYTNFILPVVELYEYEIHKYENEPYTNMKFGDIDDSPSGECDRVSIEGSESSTNADIKKSSCDPIKSIKVKIEQIGGNEVIGNCLLSYSPYDIDNLYNNYKTFFAKMQIMDLTEMNGILDEDNIKKIIDNVKNAYETQKNILIHHNIPNINKHIDNVEKIPRLTKEDINSKTIKRYELNSGIYLQNELTELINLQNDTALIYNVDLSIKNKVVIFGDFHGGFHTFFRILCRLHRYGVINLETFIINNDYKILFLGDIIDRGNYGIDILNIIFRLIIINNTDPLNPKILLNRGNHEEYSIYDTYGFKKEITKKFLNNSSNNIYYIYEYQYYLLKFFSISSSAIILNQINTNNINRIWCCHGGFPKKYLEEKLPSDKIILINDYESSQEIRWSDFGFADEDILYGFYDHSGRGRYNITGTNKFLINNNINFIIRGHQDSIGNSVLFFKNPQQYVININDNNINKLLYYNDTNKTFDKRVNGPIAKLRAHNHFYSPKIYPVLTISTNTDAGRELTSDSFALLSFDKFNGSRDINQFQNNNLNIISPIRDILKNPKFDKQSIIIKNLDKINEILEITTQYVILQFMHIKTNENIFDIIIHIDEIDRLCKKFKTLDSDRKELIFYLNSFINIIKDCVKIGDYYIEKIKQINTKLNNPVFKQNIINQDFIKEFLEEFTYYKDEYENHIKSLNPSKMTMMTMRPDDFNNPVVLLQSYKKYFGDVKTKLEEYYKYNDIDLWKEIKK